MGFYKHHIDFHNEISCTKKPLEGWDNWSARNMCELNPERFLLQIETDFHLVIAYRCTVINRYDYIFQTLGLMYQKVYKKPKDSYKLRKSIDDYNFKEYRLRGAELEKNIFQVHFSYEDAARREYCITSDQSLLYTVFSDWNERLKTSYEDALKFFKENKELYEYLIPELRYLYEKNLVHAIISDAEVVRTTEHLIKKIKHETSK